MKGVEVLVVKVDDVVLDNEFKSDVEFACALSVVLLFKFYVKKVYELFDVCVVLYVFMEVMRNVEVVKFDDIVKFEIGIVDVIVG